MLERISKKIREHRADDTLVVTGETTFAELGMDSLEMVELLMEMEDEFAVTLEPSPLLKTVGDLMKEIEGQK